MLYLKYPRFTRNEQERDFMAKICKYCRSEIDGKATVCPHCQRKQSGGVAKVVIAVIAAVIFLPAFIGACSSFRRGYNNAKRASVEVATTAEKKVSVQTGTTEADTTTITETESAVLIEAETVTEPSKVENVVVYEQNDIKITYTGIEEKQKRYEFKFLIENDTDMNICVQERDLSVNSFMTSGGISAHVAPHKKANDSITVYKVDLEKNNISSIENVEFCLRIYDWDNLSSHLDSDTITINIEQ
jgi:hypothetical protein